jgi:ribosomal protection tetracycline resistance protein
VTLTEASYSVADGPPSKRGPTSTSFDYRKVTPLVARRALERARTRVCEPALRILLEVPTHDAPTVQRLLARWGAELTGQTSVGEFSRVEARRVVARWGAELLGQASVGDLTRLEARLPAARLHELQRQLPDLTGGEGVLESWFDGYQPVQGRPPVRYGWAARPQGSMGA